ncbi:MAG: hypothetical protein HOV80_06450 [Polyangiaceae bacterium]|nr:hypothetical protein [Polyangiaceae bacterium]
MSALYRDELAPLRSQLDALRAEAEALDARLGQADELKKRRAEVAAEASELEKRMRNLHTQSTLDGLRIASPCNASWDEMVGDERVRFCGSCTKNVYNVAGMTRDEANVLFRENEGGRVCLRIFKRADGTVITADCPEGVKKKRIRRLAMVAGGLAASAAAAVAGFSHSRTMGDIAIAGGVQMPAPQPEVAAGGVEVTPHMMGEAPMPTMGTAEPVVKPVPPPVPPTARPIHSTGSR